MRTYPLRRARILALLFLLAIVLACKKEEPMDVEETPAMETSAVESSAATDLATSEMAPLDGPAPSEPMTSGKATEPTDEMPPEDGPVPKKGNPGDGGL